jgi:putative sterol carrier protein
MKIRFQYIFLIALFFSPLVSPASDTNPNKTPAEVFDGMRKSFRADKAKDVHARYQWNISGPDGGGWWIIVNDGKCDMGKGSIEKADVTFTVSDKDWVALSNGTLSGTWAYVSGRLKLDGPQSVARLLDGMFP